MTLLKNNILCPYNVTNGNVVDFPTPVAPVTNITLWFNI